MPTPIIILLVILAVLFVLFAILFVNALRLKPTAVKDPLPPTQARGNDGAVARFQEILRLETIWGENQTISNPDRSAFDKFIPTLQRLYPQVFENLELTTFNTYGILLKWKGKNPGAQPVILMAHHDVVPVKPEEWTRAPFAAEVADGRIWARGTVDTKCILAALFEATNDLLAKGYTPPRDVYLCSTNDEEVFGRSAASMVDYFKAQGITPLFVLDEGGAVIDNPPLGVKCPFAAIGVSEKGVCNSVLTMDSKGGHSSTPSINDSTSKLVFGLDTLLKNPAPSILSKPIALMLTELAAHGGLGLRLIFANLWFFKPLVLSIMKRNAETAAMVRTTYAITELEGSNQLNIIPKQAVAGINFRIHSSETVETALIRLKSYFNNEADVRVIDASEPSPISPFDDEVFAYLRRVVNCVYPDAVVAPYVQTGATDARHFARICPNTYRFGGFIFTDDQRSSIHAKDENLSVENYLRGIGFYIELIEHLDMLGQ